MKDNYYIYISVSYLIVHKIYQLIIIIIIYLNKVLQRVNILKFSTFGLSVCYPITVDDRWMDESGLHA